MENIEYLRSLGINISSTEDNKNLIISGLAKINEPDKTEIIHWIKIQKKILLYELNELTKKATNKGFAVTNKVKGFTNKTKKAVNSGFAEKVDWKNLLESETDIAFNILDRLLAGGRSCKISEWEKRCKDAGVGNLAMAMIRFVEAEDFVSFDGGIAKLKKVIP